MVHSLLIVGGTVKKRKLETHGVVAQSHDVVAQFTARPNKFDTTVLEPEEDSTSITIDQVRDLQHQLSLKPYAAKFKTGIIPEAQRLTIEAQNALLKTLEEPPAHSVLILTAPSTKNLLPTIVSRCQIVRLRAEIDLDIESEEYKKGVEDFLQLLQQGRGERLAWTENNNKSLIANRESLIATLNAWISVLRDLLLVTAGCQSLTLNFLTSSGSFTPFIPFEPSNSLNSKLDKSISLCSSILLTQKTKNLIAKTNVNPRLALEVLLLDLPTLQSA